MFDEFVIKGLKIFAIVAGSMILIGTLIPVTSPESEPWVEVPKPVPKGPGGPKKYHDVMWSKDHTYSPSIQSKDSQYNWYEDRKQDSEAWREFLEEIENRGYDLYDPEAEEIWDTYN